MTAYDLGRAKDELRTALSLITNARAGEDARRDAVHHVTIAQLLLTNPCGTIVGTSAHTAGGCIAEKPVVTV